VGDGQARQRGTLDELIEAIRAEGPVTDNVETALQLLRERSAWMHAKGSIAVDIATEPVPIACVNVIAN
jgi:hypothetical protein